MEKPTIEKTRRRHPNVDNEIMMEKRVRENNDPSTHTYAYDKYITDPFSLSYQVLCRLSHPNIIPLFASFQDQYTLYLQMEFVPNGELWTQLHDFLLGHRAQVGLPVSRGSFPFYLNFLFLYRMDLSVIEYANFD